MSRRKTLVVALLILTTGCYSYVPAEFTAVPLGEGVRVYLSREGQARLRAAGEDQIPGLADEEPVVDGVLVRREASEFSLRIPVAQRQTGFIQSTLDQQVTLPTTEVVQVRQRVVSRTKSALAVVGSTAAVGALLVTIIKGARRPVDDEQPLPDEMRVPLLRISAP